MTTSTASAVSTPRDHPPTEQDGLPVPSWAMGLKGLAETGLTRANRVRGARRLRAIVRAGVPAGGFQVEIGCGPHRVPGWLHTDVRWNAPLWLDAERPWPFPKDSVRFVFGDNVIEHITLASSRRLFAEARAVMVDGGTIRLATPDIGRITDLYLARDGRTDEVLRWHRRLGRHAEHPVDLLRLAFTEHGHERGFLWDFATLAAELEAAGFGIVTRWDAGESRSPQLRNLESRLDEEDATQLIVEATAC